ncbi:MAG TPA: YfiR family protein [Burkholderiales bacterium]|nr:YfiR family protein [Burkholderiales bacterium]
MSASRHLRRLLSALAMLACVAGARAQTAPEAELKAALVFNFALFTQWPASAFSAPGQPFVLCYADERMAGAFTSLASKTLHGRPVAVRRILPGASTAGCHVGYWHEEPRLPAGAPGATLLVADAEGFARRGGVIEIGVEDARMRFDVNVDNARASGLRVSSKLLRLARKVHGHAED